MWYLYPEILSKVSISQIDGNYYLSSFDSKNRQWGPEEIIRQFLFAKLICHYHYGQNKIRIEYPIQIGSTKKFADIVVLDEELNPYIVAETKVRKTSSSIPQLQSYINVTNAGYGIFASHTEILFFESFQGTLVQIEDIPSSQRAVKYANNERVPIADMLGFQKLFRINDKQSIVLVKNTELYINNKDLLLYKNTRKIAFEKGIVLNPNVDENHWYIITKNLFENAEDASSIKVSVKDRLLDFINQKAKNYKSTKKHDYVNDIEKMIIVYKDKIALKMKGLISAINEEDDDILKRLNKKELREILYELGFEPLQSMRIEGKNNKVHLKNISNI